MQSCAAYAQEVSLRQAANRFLRACFTGVDSGPRQQAVAAPVAALANCHRPAGFAVEPVVLPEAGLLPLEARRAGPIAITSIGRYWSDAAATTRSVARTIIFTTVSSNHWRCAISTITIFLRARQWKIFTPSTMAGIVNRSAHSTRRRSSGARSRRALIAGSRSRRDRAIGADRMRTAVR